MGHRVPREAELQDQTSKERQTTRTMHAYLRFATGGCIGRLGAGAGRRPWELPDRAARPARRSPLPVPTSSAVSSESPRPERSRCSSWARSKWSVSPPRRSPPSWRRSFPLTSATLRFRSSCASMTSYRFSIMGAIRSPGVYDLAGPVTLLEALAMAGGVNFANAEGKISVLRAEAAESADLDVGSLFEPGSGAFAFTLQPGDIVHVLERKLVEVFVYGQVANPGPARVEEPVTLLKVDQPGRWIGGARRERSNPYRPHARERRARGDQHRSR